MRTPSQLFVVASIAALLVAGLATSASFAGSYGKSKAAKAEKKDLIQTAQSAKSFNTLLTALRATDLTKTLKGTGPFTVFAPTDEAFAKLPKGTLDGLLKDPEQLKAILLYHVVSGKVLAADVVKLTEAKTVNGQDVKIDVSKGVVINGASNVVKTDVLASNGVIHVIDTVLLPAN